MKSFEQRKQEYMRNAKNYQSFIKFESEETVQGILCPDNEEQLEIAEHYIQFIKDQIIMDIYADMEVLTEVNINDNEAIDFYVRLVIDVLAGRDCSEIRDEVMQKENIGDIYYQIIAAQCQNLYELEKKILEKAICSFGYEISIMQIKFMTIILDTIMDKAIKDFSVITNAASSFHKALKKGTIPGVYSNFEIIDGEIIGGTVIIPNNGHPKTR